LIWGTDTLLEGDDLAVILFRDCKKGENEQNLNFAGKIHMERKRIINWIGLFIDCSCGSAIIG
jgi:hypothetical protein